MDRFALDLLDADTVSRLKRDPEYWQGFHDARPKSLKDQGVNVLEDPIRPGRL